MTHANVLIIEDEFIVSRDIQSSLIEFGYSVLGIVSSGEKALAFIAEQVPDILLIDIQLKGAINGIELAELIKKRYDIPFIFLTAISDETTLNRAKYAEPYGYILKPFREIDLKTTIELALYKHHQQVKIERERDLLVSIIDGKTVDKSSFLFVKSNSRLIKLKTEEIYFIEALKDYVVINTFDVRYTIHSTMKEIELKLGYNEFIRVHRSFIVRLDKIASIEFPNLQLENDKKWIPIGGSYRDDLTNRIKMI
ncbi:MAG: LytR/AlgR family response regulator transcription factor [Moraxellaceae bacterium]|jgi:two-component system response regulator LytT